MINPNYLFPMPLHAEEPHDLDFTLPLHRGPNFRYHSLSLTPISEGEEGAQLKRTVRKIDEADIVRRR
jgi:hypothetical protein